MAKTQDIKRRIRSIRNTMQLTRAMKMVSASKLRRAQERILRARPYAQRTLRILRSVAARTNPELHPLLQPPADDRVLHVVITSDKGLCGAFNASIIRAAVHSAQVHADKRLVFSTVGKKGKDYFSKRYQTHRQWVDVFRNVDFAIASEIAAELVERYLRGDAGKILLVYNEFKSAIQARPVVQQLLPIERVEIDPAAVTTEEYLYEPSAEGLLATLLPHYVEVLVFQALLESVAAEHAARMTAMDSATKNAGELIDSLTLTMNRVRQASITTEIIEVVSGAEALG
jgi:F-type H+-transporting ATPase subunit gamma